MSVRDSHCNFCGAAYADITRYPRKCGACGREVWANPIPVSVVLVPVHHAGREGVLVVRRAIEPQRGRLGLVGGFLEEHETWQEGGARETREETGIVIDVSSLRPFWFTSTEPRPNRVLLFSTCAGVDSKSFAPFVPSSETSERGLVFGARGLEDVFAFPLHVEATRRYFDSRGVSTAHDYTPV